MWVSTALLKTPLLPEWMSRKRLSRTRVADPSPFRLTTRIGSGSNAKLETRRQNRSSRSILRLPSRVLLYEIVPMRQAPTGTGAMALIFSVAFGWKLPDALQAALALENELERVTRNAKDFDPKAHSFVTVPDHV